MARRLKEKSSQQQATSSAGDGAKVEEFRIEEDQELRFEVASTSEVIVELLDGTAEIFGTELVRHKRYTFAPGARVAVYTWHGAKVTDLRYPH